MRTPAAGICSKESGIDSKRIFMERTQFSGDALPGITGPPVDASVNPSTIEAELTKDFHHLSELDSGQLTPKCTSLIRLDSAVLVRRW